MQRTAAILLICGSIIFAIAVFSPPMTSVFAVEDPVQAVTAIQDNLTGWRFANAFAALGALIAAAGIVALARHLTALGEDAQLRVTAYAGAALSVFGTLLWLIIQFDRITATPETIVSGDAVGGPWLFPLYTIVTLLGLMCIGYALLRARYPWWLGWAVIGLHGYMLVMALITWDSVPLTWYLSMFLMGAALLFVKPRIQREPTELRGAMDSLRLNE